MKSAKDENNRQEMASKLSSSAHGMTGVNQNVPVPKASASVDVSNVSNKENTPPISSLQHTSSATPDKKHVDHRQKQRNVMSGQEMNSSTDSSVDDVDIDVIDTNSSSVPDTRSISNTDITHNASATINEYHREEFKEHASNDGKKSYDGNEKQPSR